MDSFNPVTKAIDELGLMPLAEAHEVSYQSIRKWERKQVPPERVLDFCRVMKWRITPYQVRPDLYPDPNWLPPEAFRDASAA